MNQSILTLIIITFTWIYFKMFLEIGPGRDIHADLSRWKGSKDRFVEFKKFEYEQTFKLVFAMLAIVIPAAGTIINLKEIISLIGITPYVVFAGCITISILKFMFVISTANKRSIDNMRELLE